MAKKKKKKEKMTSWALLFEPLLKFAEESSTFKFLTEE